ncbi:bis(5'-nucleosyl)-tetraphosphatase PrpE [asymmetrical]-like [Biomphalaria glabrata]|uniref:Bis(5'-nucleosyl)-tetraphosphatase PrpE [asymmetrical]-like n=1 Tax=Biomphalaria glabrata TaxID=6526 RepID=A0A9U8EL50_BIOGL|nr:bis(5'-nucleosyl)-tetraphosphatase PrpE [asymmetrical]-like [Biomphalaria glabrata]KAI8783168.1 bis(5-nucleosyl)-tetraphosphatase PrpE [asymmetrical] [Biomphalaria glabrata]
MIVRAVQEKMAAILFNCMSLLRDIYNQVKPYPTKTKYGLPLPKKCHVVLTDDEIGDRPVLIIGDVHGCFDELNDLISQAQSRINTSDLFIIFVGDMLNKGPKNQEVLTLLRELTANGSASAVKGNHEESLLREYRSMRMNSDYKLSKKYQYLSTFSAEDFQYLQNLPYSLTVPKINSIVVHAGLVPGVPLERQCLIDVCHMRNLVYGESVFGPVPVAHSKPEIGVAWATLWKGPQHVYYGHDARRGLQDLPFATGLDTGCVYGQCLTGIIIDKNGDKTFVTVRAKKSYYNNNE